MQKVDCGYSVTSRGYEFAAWYKQTPSNVPIRAPIVFKHFSSAISAKALFGAVQRIMEGAQAVDRSVALQFAQYVRNKHGATSYLYHSTLNELMTCLSAYAVTVNRELPVPFNCATANSIKQAQDALKYSLCYYMHVVLEDTTDGEVE